MTFQRRQFLGWAVLGVAVLLGGGWLAHLDFDRKISTDVLDLIPADEGAPELTLVRQLASQAEARTMLLVLTETGGKPAPAGAAIRFAALLGHEPAFAEATAMADTTGRDELGRELFEQRFALLFPGWLQRRAQAYAGTGGTARDFPDWLARDTAAALSRFLTKPEALAFQEIIPSDPLLLMPDAVERLKGGLSLVQPAAGSEHAPGLVWARLAESPLTEAGQAPAFAAIARTLAATRTEFPGLEVAYTGVNRFAAASRVRIQRELAWLNLLSFAAVLTVALVFIRNTLRGLHLVPVVLMAILGAWVCLTLVFDRVHVLVFVVGSLLTGVAVDYGIYLFMQPPATPGEDYAGKVRRLAKPLLASCLTTVAGFALLLLSELPFIRQLGVFVGSGLVCALAAAVVYFATVPNPFLAARAFRPGEAFSDRARKRTRLVLAVAGIAALPGIALLKWKDDIRELEIPSPALQAEASRIQGLFGESGERTVYLTYGATLPEARAALEKFNAWLAPGAGPGSAIGLGAILPSDAAVAATREFLRTAPDFPAKLRAAFAGAGFDEDGFEKFFADYARFAANPPELDRALGALQAKMSGPVGLLLHAGRPWSWFVTIAGNAPAGPPPPEARTVSASQLQTLNGVFARYRQSALRLSLTGLVIVGVGVFLTYGLRDGVRIFAIPCGAAAGVFGYFGWLGQPLNLFHLIGAFLGICLAHNYSIFTATSAYRREPTPISVRISALTAAASFGVLALSGIPVVRALGLTVSLMVLAALLMVEFESLAPLGRKK